MFGRPIRIGRLFGIDITVSWSTLIVVVLISYSMASRSGSSVGGAVLGVAYSVLLFVSILLHELGHSLVAKRLGVEIAEIELHFFGGAAKMLSMPKTPRDEILISAAGPAVSFVLSGLAFLGLIFSSIIGLAEGSFLHHLTGLLFMANLFLGCFNMLPALPMDGGRILRAALSRRYGTLRATRIAATVARVIAVGLAIFGFVTSQWFLVIMTVFIWTLGTRELRLAEMMQNRGPGMEVYDRFGRPVGVGQGAYEINGPGQSSTGWQPSPDGQYSWSEAPSSFQPERYQGRVIVVKGPDGKLWVITQR